MQLIRSVANPRATESGFGTLDLLIALTIISSLLLVASMTFGVQVRSPHLAALALQSALAEARAISQMQQADATDIRLPTGATVSVDVDPANKDHSIISVFGSRPIQNPNSSLSGTKTVSLDLPSDIGFPVQRVAAIFTIRQIGKPAQTGKFSILLSSAGYSSIVPGYVYAPGSPILTADPSCRDAGTTINASLGSLSEIHAFHCRGGVYDASIAQ